jgi:hypothetical protein
MKTTRKALWIFASLTAFSTAVMSGQISTLTTFSDGNVLTAAELNDNNTAIMTAVNGNDTAITAAVNDINSRHKVYVIGDTGPAGGLVFHIENGGRNGLEAATEDLKNGSDEFGVDWGCTSTEISGADGVLIERGATNTLDIVEQCTEADIASKLAYDYVSDTDYTDWFLPSKDELAAMVENSVFAASSGVDLFYWSSSETGAATVWCQNSNNGDQFENYPKSPLLPQVKARVRAVRAF